MTYINIEPLTGIGPSRAPGKRHCCVVVWAVSTDGASSFQVSLTRYRRVSSET